MAVRDIRGPQHAVHGRDASRWYPWLVVVACFGLTLTLGETFWSFGVFFKPLEQEFGWSRAAVSSIFTAFLLGYAVSVVASGKAADLYNPKPVLLASAVLIGAGLSLCSLANSIHQFRFFLLLVGLGSGATWSVPNSTVQRWFYKRRDAGIALGLVISGVGVGALVFAPLINFLIQTVGWRATFLLIGLLFFVIILSSTFAIRPSPPETMVVRRTRRNHAAPPEVVATGVNHPLRTWAFAATVFVVSAGMFIFQSISAHMVPHAIDMGISPSAAAAALGLMGGLSIPGRLLSGLLSARVGWHRLLALSFLGMGASVVWLWMVRDIWMLYVFALFYGVFHGIRIAGGVGVLPEIFGIRSLGELIGVSASLGQVIGSFSPYVSGAIFDATGSYAPAFLIVFLLAIAAAVVAALLKRIGRRIVPDGSS